MSLYIHLEPPFDYIVTDSRGAEKSRGQLDELKDVSKIKAKGQKIGVVPGQYVNTRTIGLPTNNRKKIAKVLPNALENEVIGEIHSLFFRLVGPANKKVKHALVVDKELLKVWLAATEEAGIRLDKLIPDFALMPSHESADYSLVFDETGYVYVHEGSFHKKKIRQEFLGLWSNSKTQKPDSHAMGDALSDSSICIACNNEVSLRRYGFSGKVDVVSWPVKENWGDWIGRNHRSVAEFNLLEGEFTPSHKVEKYGGMKFALFICAIAVFVKIGGDSYDYIRLIKEEARLDNRIRTLFIETFPEVKRVVNPRVQMLNKIAEIKGKNRGDNELLAILSLLSPVMRLSNLEFESMDYRNNELVFVCLLANFSLLDNFHQRLIRVDKLDITLISSGSLNGKISGRFIAKLKPH